MKKILTSLLFICYLFVYAQNDSTFIFIEKNGIYASPLALPKEFKIYGLQKTDSSKTKRYEEIKIRWIKSPKTEFTGSGFRIDTTDIHGQFLIAVNFVLPNHIYLYENRKYLFECNNNYLYPGKSFILESYIHKWNGADYMDLSTTGIVSDSIIKLDLKVRSKTIGTVTGAIPKVILEGHFNDDWFSDFVLKEGNSYKMYLSYEWSYDTINCKFILGDIVPEF